MTEFEEKMDEERQRVEMDEWIATKMATKDDLNRALFWGIVIFIVATSLLTICVKLLSIALMVG